VAVGDFDIVRSVRLPNEADSILIIHSDAVLSGALAFQGLKPVSRRHSEVAQICARLDLIQFPPSYSLDRLPSAAPPRLKKLPGSSIPEALDHTRRV
jgi:hypothetical protein